jgi:hypothetical protein
LMSLLPIMRKLHIISFGTLTLLLGCSQKTDSGLTKNEIREITSAVSQQSTNKIMGFGVSSNGDVIVTTEKPENFFFHHSPTGYVMETNTMQQVPMQWGH